jgi:hypothetical protein
VVATTVITFTINSINTCITTTTYTYSTIYNTINLPTNTIFNVVSIINNNSLFFCIISTATFYLYIPFPSPNVSSVCSGYQPLFNTHITVREWSGHSAVLSNCLFFFFLSKTIITNCTQWCILFGSAGLFGECVWVYQIHFTNNL